MCFANYDDGVDVYLRVSAWPVDTWALYTITDQAHPENWHKATTMTFIKNLEWTIEEIYEQGTKRKADEMDP